MSWTLKIIILLLIINLLYSYYLSKEIVNPKRYYLVDENGEIISHINTNGALSYGFPREPRWRLPDAKQAKEVYPNLKIIDCATLEELE